VTEQQVGSDRVVVDFDHHSPTLAADNHGVYARTRTSCPVAWSPHYDGFWVVTGYREVAEAARDDVAFSSEHDVDGSGRGYQGILIPPNENRSGTIELDPPEFNTFRRILNPPFAPARIEELEPKIVDYTTSLIDRVIEAGTFDIVLDLASPLPAIMTMELLGLPISYWERYADMMHRGVYTPPDAPEHAEVIEGTMWIVESLIEAVADRQANPRDDLISYLCQSQVGDRPMSAEEVVENCFLIVAGGVDTTTALIANALRWLWQHPEERTRLREDASLMPLAGEEFLRYFCPVQGQARTATRPCTLGPQQLSEGDRVYLSWAAASADPAQFSEPDEVQLDRFPNRHAAFGLGAHRCLGSNLARTEFGIVVSQVLERMPDYEVLDDQSRKYPTIGVVNGWVTMPARFTPGQKIGTGIDVHNL